jgi:anthranilate synthase component 1
MNVASLDEFLHLAQGKRTPVFHDVLADIETPVSAYWKLAHDQEHSFLLESVTGGESLARYSVLGVRPRRVLRTKNRVVRWSDALPQELPEGKDPLHILQEALGDPVPPTPGMPAFIGGAVGMLSYDLVRFFEKLPEQAKDDLNVDDLAMMIADTVVVFDHAKNLIRIIVAADPSPEGFVFAQKEIGWVLARLRAPMPELPKHQGEPYPVESNMDASYFERMVQQMRRYITQGDGIQMVPAQRFRTKVDAHPLTVYRALRSINPSPYMFLIRFGDFDLVGASPELHASLHGRKARVRPIAGTRWRGKTEEEDEALAKELLADEKERAEHIMLVDLGRNDLGRVCEYGSVQVNDLMVVERYSHVMHIVSDVSGTIQEGRNAFDLIRATFPAGTVSGAPKVRAMEIIEELEPTRRGSYAGAVGFFSYTGDMDTCIALRTIYLKDGYGYVQAGGGVVYDSVPELEYRESRNKARACLQALEAAQAGLDRLML